MPPPSALYMMCLLVLHSQANLQSWSQESYLDVEFTLSCNDSSVNLTGRGAVTGAWTKLGYHGDLMTNDDYQLSDRNLSLVIKKVTNEMAGIYFCDINDQIGENVGRVVRGLNIVEHPYRDVLDTYRTNIIRGVVTTAAVVALVVGVCLIDRFQYRSRDRTDSHTRPLTQSPLGGPHSGPLEEDSGAYKPYGSFKVDDIATHL
ncbi:hypothetical protein BsWGS_27088 [Bradybaena similaris]